MTREEAIEILQGAIKKPNTKDGYLGQAIDMAIEALKQNEQAAEWYKTFVEKFDSCEDCISRADALVSIKNLYPDMPIVNIMGARQKWLEKYAPYFECENVIELLPSVYPQNTDVLDKIRAEIENDWQLRDFPASSFSCGLRCAIEIIDKYRGEKNE